MILLRRILGRPLTFGCHKMGFGVRLTEEARAIRRELTAGIFSQVPVTPRKSDAAACGHDPLIVIPAKAGTRYVAPYWLITVTLENRIARASR